MPDTILKSGIWGDLWNFSIGMFLFQRFIFQDYCVSPVYLQFRFWSEVYNEAVRW